MPIPPRFEIYIGTGGGKKGQRRPVSFLVSPVRRGQSRFRKTLGPTPIGSFFGHAPTFPEAYDIILTVTNRLIKSQDCIV